MLSPFNMLFEYLHQPLILMEVSYNEARGEILTVENYEFYVKFNIN